MSSVKWIKLVSDMFDNRKIKQIRKMPDSDAIIVIWLQILCLAGHTNDNGLVYFSKDIPYTDEMLSTEFDRPVATIRLALSVLVKFGMIEIINDILMVTNWEKYQNQGRLESIRDYNREKKRESRQRQKLLLHDLSLTCQTRQATDIEVEVESKKKSKEKNKDVFEVYVNGDETLLAALRSYEKMRVSLNNKAFPDRAKEILCQKLDILKKEHNDLVECIDHSIKHHMLSVYPVEKGDDHAQAGSDHGNDIWDIPISLTL